MNTEQLEALLRYIDNVADHHGAHWNVERGRNEDGEYEWFLTIDGQSDMVPDQTARAGTWAAWTNARTWRRSEELMPALLATAELLQREISSDELDEYASDTGFDRSEVTP